MVTLRAFFTPAEAALAKMERKKLEGRVKKDGSGEDRELRIVESEL